MDRSSPGARQSPAVVTARFGPFEFDRETLELRRSGHVVRLQPQPSQVLALLLSQPGRLVTREELRDAVWYGRVVEFEGGINFAIRQVRKALGDAADHPVYLETVHGRGYRFIGDVTPLPRSARREVPRSRAVRLALAIVALLAVTTAGAVAVASRSRDDGANAASRVIVAVLPFEEVGNGEGLAAFSLGLTEDLITELALLGSERLGAIAPTSMQSLLTSTQAAAALRERLGADYAVRGVIRQIDGERRITVRVERTADGTQVLARRYDRRAGNDLTVQADIAQDIVTALSIGVLRESIVPREIDLSSPIRDSLLAARWLLRQGSPADIGRALDRLDWIRNAVPEHAPAWVLTSRARRMTGDRRGAVVAATRAVRLDSNLAEAQFEFGHGARETFRLDEALRAYRRAVALAPGIARYHQWLAHFLANMLEFDDAIRHMEFAKRLDPISSAVDFDLYMIYVAAHRWRDANSHCRASQDLIPREVWPRVCLFTVAYFDGQPRTAARIAREIMEMLGADRGAPEGEADPDRVIRVYFAWDLARLESLRERGGWAPDYNFARAYGRLADRDAVLAYLATIAADRDPSLLWAPREVWFEFLHGDPAFRRLMRDAGLPAP